MFFYFVFMWVANNLADSFKFGIQFEVGVTVITETVTYYTCSGTTMQNTNGQVFLVTDDKIVAKESCRLTLLPEDISRLIEYTSVGNTTLKSVSFKVEEVGTNQLNVDWATLTAWKGYRCRTIGFSNGIHEDAPRIAIPYPTSANFVSVESQPDILPTNVPESGLYDLRFISGSNSNKIRNAKSFNNTYNKSLSFQDLHLCAMLEIQNDAEAKKLLVQIKPDNPVTCALYLQETFETRKKRNTNPNRRIHIAEIFRTEGNIYILYTFRQNQVYLQIRNGSNILAVFNAAVNEYPNPAPEISFGASDISLNIYNAAKQGQQPYTETATELFIGKKCKAFEPNVILEIAYITGSSAVTEFNTKLYRWHEVKIDNMKTKGNLITATYELSSRAKCLP